MLFILSFVGTICFWIQWEIKCLTKVISCIGEISNSLNVLTKPIKINNKDGAKKLEDIKGKITFKNIKFGYSNEK